jgi:hypothetical protein
LALVGVPINGPVINIMYNILGLILILFMIYHLCWVVWGLLLDLLVAAGIQYDLLVAVHVMVGLLPNLIDTPD